MRWILLGSAAMFLAANVALSAGPKSPQAIWYVSPGGRDTSSGTRPNDQDKDGPFATPEHALTASRALPAGTPRKIVLVAGRYYLDKPLLLDNRDAGLTIEGAGAGKTILYGGRRITGWQPDGEHFQAAAVPEVKAGSWDFRALVVNDRLCERARLPETGTFRHESNFPVRWMSTAGGGWERKPTQKELTTLHYKKGDLGPWLRPANAEITIFHMWDESMVGVAGIDPQTRTLTFSSPAGHPPGAFNKHEYVVWNIRKGMKHPGQWYLDREKGRIVYWPLPGEDMATAQVVAPRVETVLEIRGSQKQPVSDITLRAFTISTTTTPCRAGGFGACRYRGALQATWTRNLRLEALEVTNVAGHAIREWGGADITIRDCALHHLGAGGIRMGGGSGRVENNRLHHLGLLYPSAIGLSAGGAYAIRRNVIHHCPYSGMSIGGKNTIIEENLIHHCMQILHDGAAIYVGGAQNNIIRRNLVRDVVKIGEGYGVSAYYLDEKCRGCVVEKNVAVGVAMPAHNHMTLNCVLRDNVFLCDGDMTLGFSRCAGQKVLGNTFQLDGKLKILDPDAINEWQDNLIVQAGTVEPTLADNVPRPTPKTRTKPLYAVAKLLNTPPVIDGKIDGGEWPPRGIEPHELPDQRRSRGAPTMIKFGYDEASLYVGVSVVTMFPAERKLGHAWQTDEGVEIAVQARQPNQPPGVVVLRGFADGTLEAVTVPGTPPELTRTLRDATRYAAHVGKHTWTCEWRIPFKLLGFTPGPNAWLPLNVTIYRSEDRQSIQWAGVGTESWNLEYGGRVRCGPPKSGN